ncbi:switch 2 [Aristolochia californica]|uniref:switch 2 n=1 Tax=Aristolochia californica TaxID=171875 RepID=UPI0035D7FA55
MSLKSFKETLKACTLSSSRSSSSSSFTSASHLHDFESDTIANQRKPPKSSISRQLQRLQDPIIPTTKPEQKPKDHEDKRRERSEIPSEPGPAVPLSVPTGPFEPLMLSSPGEADVVQVPASINCRLFEHQREGVKFLYSLYKKNHGGVLGDDMGLGKTIQTIAFLAAVFGKDQENSGSKKPHANYLGPVLVVCPTSVIRNWENEFAEWGTFKIAAYHGQNRDLILNKLAARGVEILITSFDTFRIHDKILLEVKWEIVIVDEAHRLKNEKSQLYKSFLGFKTAKRYGLTGTIMQNKIMELFNLLDWVAPGSLGTREHFHDFYDEPLKHGQRLTAPKRCLEIAVDRRKHLVSVLSRYFLRRTKEETIGHLLRGKEDNVVFCAMSELQKRVYRRTLELPELQCLMNKDLPCSCGSPLTQVECCKRIVPNGIIWSYLHRDQPEGCDSCPFCLVLPCLIKLQQISNHLELIKPNARDEAEKQKKDAEFASAVFGADMDLVGGNIPSESFLGLSDVEHCGKMRALEKLMSAWTSFGDKILLFSYSVRMLDILEKFLVRKGYCFSRLDGSTPMSSRQSLVDDFNSSPSKQVFLISTRAGGLGLNLVSANRVVLFDPNWNPAQDLQAQDRSFRYGQKRHVIVFRLLAAGSLEELVYSRQVYKQQLSNIAVSGKMERRYFEGVQDCKEFRGELFGICNLFRDLSDKLFTREIIELQENHRSQYTSNDEREDPSERRGIAESPSGPKDLSISEKKKPKFLDLGIVYSHRNEDIINSKPGILDQWKTDETSVETTSYTYIQQASDRHKTNRPVEDDRGPTKKEKTRSEYGLLAGFVGMGELEFSEWLLSASPSQREKALRDYKNHKKKPRVEVS